MSLRSKVIRLAAQQAPGAPLQRVLLAALFPSLFDIGDPVWIESQGQRLAGHVRSVSFSAGKVRYAVQVDGSTFRALDSILVTPRPEGEKLDYGFDNEG
jgi:hypothetical protein